MKTIKQKNNKKTSSKITSTEVKQSVSKKASPKTTPTKTKRRVKKNIEKQKISWQDKFKGIKIDWALITVVILAILFFVYSSLFNYYGQQANFVKWSSPDETANYNVAKLYAQTGSLMYNEPINPKIDELIHPRSYRSDNGDVKPVSFLGMSVLYGKLGNIFGIGIIPYLTQFFAAISIIFFFLLIRRLFDRSVALISAFLLAGFPVYIYYAARSMFHNVPFIAFLIIGLYFAVAMVQNAEQLKGAKKRGEEIINKLAIRNWSLLQAGLAGLFIGVATTMRTSELLWLGPLLIVLWFCNFTKVGLTKLLLFIALFTIAFLPVLYWDTILYGSPFNSGYPQLNESVVSITSNSAQIVKSTVQQEFAKVPSLAQKLTDTLFFFGLNVRHAGAMFYHYFYQMFSWLFWLAITGGITFLSYWGWQKKRHWKYILGYFVIFPILILYYGSWVFYDNPDPNSFTIGNSYTRYWLPLYLGVMPFAALAITNLTRWVFRSKYIYRPIRISIMFGLLMYSAFFVAYGSEEGLVPSIERRLADRNQYETVINSTESNAVIITTYHDKLFFPERKVIVAPITDKELDKRFAIAAKLMPVYYYNFTFPQKDLDYLNASLLRSVDLGIRPIKKVTDEFTLYKIESRQIVN
jgi:hypothetical protein